MDASHDTWNIEKYHWQVFHVWYLFGLSYFWYPENTIMISTIQYWICSTNFTAACNSAVIRWIEILSLLSQDNWQINFLTKRHGTYSGNSLQLTSCKLVQTMPGKRIYVMQLQSFKDSSFYQSTEWDIEVMYKRLGRKYLSSHSSPLEHENKNWKQLSRGSTQCQLRDENHDVTSAL